MKFSKNISVESNKLVAVVAVAVAVEEGLGVVIEDETVKIEGELGVSIKSNKDTTGSVDAVVDSVLGAAVQSPITTVGEEVGCFILILLAGLLGVVM